MGGKSGRTSGRGELRLVGELDIETYRAALSSVGVGAAYTPRTPVEEGDAVAAALAQQPAPFCFEHRGEYLDLETALPRALLRAGLERETVRTFARELLHLVRFFSGLTGEPRPLVELCVGEQPPRSEGRAMALIAPLLCRSQPAATCVEVPGRGLEYERAPELWLQVSTEREPYFFAGPGLLPAPPVDRELLLVSMPIGPSHQGSLALSMLQGTVPECNSEILYFTLSFAERIGTAMYSWLGNSQPRESALVGEWLFSEALFGDAAPDADAYVREILVGIPAYELADIMRMRALVPGFLDDCLARVLARNPRIVGFTSVFAQHVASLALARRIKQARPEITILFGGANCEGCMGREAAQRFDFIDAVVSGEGERVFPQLVAAALAGEPLPRLPGVHSRRFAALPTSEPGSAPIVEAMDELPYANHDDFFAQWERAPFIAAHDPRVMFETSRGCWWGAKHHCTFCGLNGETLKFRAKSGERAMAELEALVRRHPGRAVCVVDNILDMKYFRSFLPALAASGLDIQLFYETKSNLKKEQIAALHAAGIKIIQPGIESFADSVLELMRKGVSALQNIQLLKWCLELDVTPYWNILWGFPGESADEYFRIAELMPSLHHLTPPTAVASLRLDRFSPSFEERDARGFVNVRPWRSYAHIYPFEPDVLARIAYYFDYDYADGREPDRYAAPMVEQAERWRAEFDRSHLVHLDKGSDLVIADTRRCAARRLTVLSGVERALYLACDGATKLAGLPATLTEVAGRALTVADVEDILAPLLRERLMLRLGDQLLSLSVPHRPPPAARE